MTSFLYSIADGLYTWVALAIHSVIYSAEGDDPWEQ